jgi:hypothetical protein
MGDRLSTNQWMSTDAPLVSADGRYAAYLQDDANFVLCHATNGAADLGRPYWSAFGNAAGAVGGPRTGPHFYAVMQSDGNFVCYNGSGPTNQGAPYWATQTNRAAQAQYTAIMQTDGNFVLYAGTPSPGVPAIWASGTNWVSQGVTSGNRLTSDSNAGYVSAWITPTNALVSADGRFAAYLQLDGNLVLCHTTNGAPNPGQPYWSVFNNGGGHGNVGGGPHSAAMQADGNFVLYSGFPYVRGGASGSPYWATNTAADTNLYTAIIQTDGNFVVYYGAPTNDPSNPGSFRATWASNTPNWPPPVDTSANWLS